jgi:hypothetical protein
MISPSATIRTFGAGQHTTMLANAAFGDAPGCWPLPAATTPTELWLRAVAAGGQGRYSCADSDLATLRRVAGNGPLASLAHSTHGSFLRQLGWHQLARGWDGRALALARGGTGAGGPAPWAADAASDALIGLAADALGVGRFAASARLLGRARTLVSDDPRPRPRLRLAWVSAELAMATGDGPAAVGHAERAVELVLASDAVPMSARHAVKTEVILAAALCSAGQLERARAVADNALDVTERLELTPLRWALACLLADIGSVAHSSKQVLSVRELCRDTVRRRGGLWSGG